MAPGLLGETVTSDRVRIRADRHPAKPLPRNGKVRGRDSGPAKPMVRLTPPLGRGGNMGSPNYPAGDN